MSRPVPTLAQRDNPTNQPPENQSKNPSNEDALPLPKWLGRIYYVFPIVLYVPDMIFNFYVYSDGSGIKMNKLDITQIPLLVLWGFLSAGIVGMAWLLSILAPWHWVRKNRFQSLMCWAGVFIATGITTWNSLAYRSTQFVSFKTDEWIMGATGTHVPFSLTMVLVSISPPFWGLFWAIVQPSERKRSKQQEEEDFQQKLERMRQEAEIKRLKAETNAQIREAQLKGLAATVRAARAQIGDGTQQPQTTVTPEEDAVPADRVVALPAGGNVRRLGSRRNTEETTESGEHEVVRGGGANVSYSAAARQRDDVFHAPDPGSISQSSLLLDRGSGENETVVSTTRTGLPRASTLLRNYADGEHVMRAIDSDVEQMRVRGLKVTIKSFAEFRGIELTLSKQLLAKWKDWKQQQEQQAQLQAQAQAAAQAAENPSAADSMPGESGEDAPNEMAAGE
jgi:hypothetical protein